MVCLDRDGLQGELSGAVTELADKLQGEGGDATERHHAPTASERRVHIGCHHQGDLGLHSAERGKLVYEL